MPTEIYRADFANRLDEWRLVSSNPKSAMSVVDGKLRIDGKQDCTVWLTSRKLKGDFRLRVRAQTVGEEGAENINLIFLLWCADGADPLDARFTVDDHRLAFKDVSRGYMATLTKKWCRLRRNPGYELVSDRPEVRTVRGREHVIEITRTGPRVLYALDGFLVHDYTDAETFGPGRFAFRTWGTALDVLDFTISAP